MLASDAPPVLLTGSALGDSQRLQLENAWTELRWRQYARSPERFFADCVYIPTQEDSGDHRGRIKFELFDHQREDLQVFQGNRFVVVLKGRQIGLSTVVGGLALWRCLFRPGSVILWVSNNQDNANKAVHMLGVMWDFLPGWVKARAPQPTAKQAGKREWTFADGMTSRIRTFAGTATATASETASIVILDEFALVDPNIQDDLLRSATPTTDAGGALWMISTARGGHNRFAKTYRKALRGESQFVPVFHPWMVSHFVNPKARQMSGCPECEGRGLVYTQEEGLRGEIYCQRCVDTSVYEAKAREFDEKPWLIHAEYPSTEEEAFRESGNPVFRDLPLEEDCETQWTRGFFYRDGEGRVTFNEDETGHVRLRDDVFLDGPAHWREYVLFVDPSEGVGGDYTAGTVLTWDDDALPTIVGWWHANDVQAVDAAREFDLMGRWFAGAGNAALLAVETTGGYGSAMLTELNVHRHYPNLYVHVPSDNRRRQRATKLGFPMSWQKRPMVTDRLSEYMTVDKQVGAIHPLLRSELATFVRTEKGRLEADVGCHDDLVMSLAGALWVLVEDTTAATRPSSDEKSTREVPVRLKQTYEKITAARAMEQEQRERWERRVSRRVEARKRQQDRRKSRRLKVGA